nr:MAG: ORF1 [Torque teno virus]
MAWGWWRRRRWAPRRRWRRRRWRRRPLRRRRFRRPVRRAARRRRAVRRRRRRGRRRYRRGWRRRRYLRRGRRKRKLVLTQWNPPIVRRCYIKGGLPLIICGSPRFFFNYGYHSDDYTPQPLAFGGGMSTVTFSLEVLYDQYQRHLNRWSFPNDQLDLARYRGCSFRFYRHPHVDFIVEYEIKPPMKMDQFTGPNTHPGMQMLKKHKILVLSYDTHPGGRAYVKLKLPPPRLFEDKWYTQHDLCKVPLVSLRSTTASLRYPFCSPQTNNPCTTFQVCRKEYNEVIGIYCKENQSDNTYTKYKDKINKFEKWLYETCSHYQTFATESRLGAPPKFMPDGKTNTQQSSWQNYWAKSTEQYSGTPTTTTDQMYKIPKDSNYGHCTYYVNNNIFKEYIKKRRDTNFKWVNEGPISGKHWQKPTLTEPICPYYEYRLGWFSNIFVGPNRYNTQFQTAYMDTTYNPLMDKGDGNHVWFQYHSKVGTDMSEGNIKCHIQDLPLWCIFFGYSDYIESQLGPYQDHESVGLVCCICPYTQPPMYNKQNPTQGFIFYDTNFGNGKMPSGEGQVPVWWQNRWRPQLWFQQQVMNDICKTGPYAYRDEYKNVVLTAYYTFKFNWGGDMFYPQIIKNPCGDTGALAGTSRQPRQVQVVSPLSMGPQWILHTFDSRRGFYNEKALKRMFQKPGFDESYTWQPKRPRLFTEPQLPELVAVSGSREEKEQSSQEESEAEALPETETQLQQLLLRQLHKQKLIQHQLQALAVQVTKTQANLHLNPQFFPLK